MWRNRASELEIKVKEQDEKNTVLLSELTTTKEKLSEYQTLRLEVQIEE